MAKLTFILKPFWRYVIPQHVMLIFPLICHPCTYGTMSHHSRLLNFTCFTHPSFSKSAKTSCDTSAVTHLRLLAGLDSLHEYHVLPASFPLLVEHRHADDIIFKERHLFTDVIPHDTHKDVTVGACCTLYIVWNG